MLVRRKDLSQADVETVDAGVNARLEAAFGSVDTLKKELAAAAMGQFGSGFNLADPQQARRDFKKAFLRALKAVLVVYPEAQIEVTDNGLVLLPSRPHIPPAGAQPELF